MSGGVDSSVAALVLRDQGHHVTGATLKLWGGESDAGCCSVGDVEDARRVAQTLGVDHHVFNYSEEFEDRVVRRYVDDHAQGLTPNPCVECNRAIKFDMLLGRSERLGFDALATGHHARIERARAGHSGAHGLRRGADTLKDQSYVLSMLGQRELARVLFPVGDMTKDQVRALAASLGLRTAGKPDSQDVCFIGRTDGRRGFLADRIGLTPAEVFDTSGARVGELDAVELVTVGQRRGMGHGTDGRRRYVVAVDVPARRVTVGRAEDAAVGSVDLRRDTVTWTDRPLPSGAAAVAQTSAHGRPAPCRVVIGRDTVAVRFDSPQRPVAPGQTVALYDAADPDAVVGAGIAA